MSKQRTTPNSAEEQWYKDENDDQKDKIEGNSSEYYNNQYLK